MRTGLVFAVITLLLCSSPAWSAFTISIIHSYHKEYAWEQSLNQGLKESLPQDAVVDHYYLDTKRIPTSAHAAAEAARRHLQTTRPDLIILCDDNACRYLGPGLKNQSTPVVYLGLNRNPRDYGLYPSPNMTGVLERPILKRSLHAMCRMVNPKDTKVLVLFDSDTTSSASIQEAFKGLTQLRLGAVEVEIRQLSLEREWHNAILTARELGFETIYIGLYHTLRNDHGQHVSDEAILAWSNANTPLPLFAFWDFAVGEGMTIGGYVLSGRDQGLEAGALATRILGGEKPCSIPPRTASPGRYIFSVSELARFHVDLPESIRAQALFVP